MKTKNWLAAFAVPLTVADYASLAGLSNLTARGQIESWEKAGALYDAGKVRGVRRGPPPTRYCADRKTAEKYRKAWGESEAARCGDREERPERPVRSVSPGVMLREAYLSATGAELEAGVKQILHNGCVVATNHIFEFLKWLLLRHPDAVRKIGSGVAAIWMGPNGHGQRTFFLLRNDGTWTDFDYNVCITPPTPISDFKKAARWAVDPQTFAFKKKAFEGRTHVPCPVSGSLVSFYDAHVDHMPPHTFDAMLADFCRREKIELGEVEESKDGSMVYRLKDRELEARWAVFHLMNARLRVISAHANLSSAKKESNASVKGEDSTGTGA